MNIVFFGSSKYSTIVEQAVHKKYPISLVVTIPERKSGSQILTSPVKTVADANNIPVITADKLTDEVIEQIKHLPSPLSSPKGRGSISPRPLGEGQGEGPDFIIVADYGLLLPEKLLELPNKAPLNVHHSLLPKFRGPSPAPFAILSGDTKTGVTIMEMAEGLDTGNILAQKEYTILPTDTTDTLLTKLNTLGAEILLEVLGDFDRFYENRKKQDELQATFTKQLTKQDGFIDLSKLQNLSELEIGNWKLEIARKVRAYYPWPGVWFTYRINNQEVRIKLLPASVKKDLTPTLSYEEREKSFILLQVEGKRAVSVKDFLNGYPKEGKELLQKLHFI